MKIHLITRLNSITNDAERHIVAPASQKLIDSTDFSRMSALQSALKGQPDVRLEKVSDAKAKISSPLYPPLELIQGISRLIADQILDSNNTES